MIASLTLPTTGTFRFSPGNRLSLAGTTRSISKMSFAAVNPCKSAIHASTATAPAVETRKSRSASLYEVLKVNRNASPVEIKTAYRSLAKVYHPDTSSSSHSDSSDGRDFIEIHKAYTTLSDPAAKALYDLSLSARSRGRPFGYAAVVSRSGFYPTRRWETDQCW
ncbi:unnamed protein product [Camellia sinensis]